MYCIVNISLYSTSETDNCLEVLLLATLVPDFTRHNIYDSIRVLGISLQAKNKSDKFNSITQQTRKIIIIATVVIETGTVPRNLQAN